MTHRTNTAQYAPLSWKRWNTAGSLMITQDSPTPEGQMAPIVKTRKGTAALLTCSLHELQFFEKRKAIRALFVRWESYKSRSQSSPRLGAALFNLGPWHEQQDEVVKG